jgi:hypothetical protein
MRDAPRSPAATPAATEQFPTNGRKSQHRSRELMLRQNMLRISHSTEIHQADSPRMPWMDGSMMYLLVLGQK